MKYSNTRTLKTLNTKKLLLQAGLVILFFAAVGLLAWYCSENAFWNHLSAE